MQEFNIKRWLDTEAYQKQKAIIQEEVNTLKRVNSFAAITLANPRRTMGVDYSVFKKSPEERGQLITLKKQWISKPFQVVERYTF